MTTYDMGSERRTHLARRGLVALVVALLAATVAGAVLTARSVDARQRDRFEQQATRLDTALAERMRAYEQVLRGGLGLFVSSADVTRDDWIRYVGTLRLAERYPGFKSLSYAPAVRPDALEQFVADVRRTDARPGDERPFTLSEPAGSTGVPRVHAPIRFVGPDDAVNRLVLGVDMMREPVRRATMERAAAEGVAVASPRLRLSGSASDEAGFIVYVPVVRDGELQGWLTAAFLAETFAEGIEVARATDLDVELRDGTGPDAALLHSTAGVGSDGGPVALADTADAPFADTRTGAGARRHLAGPLRRPRRLRPGPPAARPVAGAAARPRPDRRRGAAGPRRRAVARRRRAPRAPVGLAAPRPRGGRGRHPGHLDLPGDDVARDPHAAQRRARRRQPAAGDRPRRRAGVVRRRHRPDGGQHLLHVVNDVLDLSKAEAGRVVIEQAPLDLEQCLTTVLDLLGPEARRGQVALTVERTAPRHLLGDVARLRQVLLNLVGNAVKFTPAGGRVTLAAFPVPPEDGDLVGFEVADTGVGIAPERLDELFDPYVQADASTTRVHGGTGLGLPIARRLVEAMGGTVTVASEPGVGTTFRFTVRLPEAAPEPAAPAPVVERAALQVLVADDDELSRDLLVAMLHRLGHEADAVDDGAAAVEAAARTAYDVVLLDQHMPGLGGVEAARLIRAQRNGSGPRIVAVSGSTGAFGDAADDEVPKPVVLGALAAVLGSAAGEGGADRGVQGGA